MDVDRMSSRSLSSGRDYDSDGSREPETSSEGSFVSDNQDLLSSLEMSIVVQPPESAAVGQLLYPPLVVQVSHRSEVHSVYSLCDQASTLMAGWTVLTADGARLANDRAGALVGTSKTSTSVYSLLPSEDEHEFGFIAFPNITFHEPGSYRLEVFLRQLPHPALCSLVTPIINVDYHLESVGPCTCAPKAMLMLLLMLLKLGESGGYFVPFRNEDSVNCGNRRSLTILRACK